MIIMTSPWSNAANFRVIKQNIPYLTRRRKIVHKPLCRSPVVGSALPSCTADLRTVGTHWSNIEAQTVRVPGMWREWCAIEQTNISHSERIGSPLLTNVLDQSYRFGATKLAGAISRGPIVVVPTIGLTAG
jgi:hypothetical protein